MDTSFNHEQSLTLINEMITRAQNNVKQQGATGLIYWGYLTAAVAIINCVLLHTMNEPNQSYWIWWIMLPAGVVSYFIERRADKKKLVKTHIDKIAGMIWAGFLISFGVFTAVLHTAYGWWDAYQVFRLNTPVIMIMVGMGQFITACVFRHKMWYAIAALTWTGALVCAILATDMQFIVFAACVILGFAVPGHVLNHQAKKSHV
jgi:MFS family permease